MAQPGNFTPILLYGSSTPTNVPLAANLTNSATGSEIAINVADKNLFFKDSGGVVNTVPIRQSGTSSNGWLSSTDWNTFNNKSNTNGTVTSVAALTIGTTGTDLSSTVANGTTTPVITLNVPTASAANRGALSAADWSTFNGKQAALVSGTNIKTVGGVTLLGSGDVGTIGTGYGGTGLTSFTANGIVYASSTSALATGSGLTFNGSTLAVATASNTLATFTTSGGQQALIFANSGGIAYGIGSAGSITGDYIYFDSSHFFKVQVNNVEALRLDANGNLGLGVSSIPGNTTNRVLIAQGSDSANLIVTRTGNESGSLYAFGGNIYVGSSTNHPLLFVTNGTQRMDISTAGIVTMNAYGAGAATFSAAGVISSVSDETWKIKDGVPVNPDEMLQKLEPGYWFYNEEKAPIFGEDRQLGFYAQNVHNAIGVEAAPIPEEGKPWGYYDRSVLAVTVMSLQNALKTIEELNNKFDAYVASHP